MRCGESLLRDTTNAELRAGEDELMNEDNPHTVRKPSFVNKEILMDINFLLIKHVLKGFKIAILIGCPSQHPHLSAL